MIKFNDIVIGACVDTRLSQSSDDTTKSTNKRKQSSQQKRQPKQKQAKEGPPAKKRARKGSVAKQEEDYDSYMESTKVQLCALPPLRILEPDVKPNFNVCPVFGSGSLTPGKLCNSSIVTFVDIFRLVFNISAETKLKGSFGRCLLFGQPDLYSTSPFGDNPPPPSISLPPTPPPQRGFYNQEFPSQSRGE